MFDRPQRSVDRIEPVESGFLPAISSVVLPEDFGFPTAVTGVAPVDSGFLPGSRGVVPVVSTFPPTDTSVAPADSCLTPPVSGKASAVSSVQFRSAPTSECPPRVEHGVGGVRPLVATPGLQEPDLGVLTDIRLMDGFDGTPHTSFFPIPLGPAEAQAIEASDYHAPHAYMRMTT